MANKYVNLFYLEKTKKTKKTKKQIKKNGK